MNFSIKKSFPVNPMQAEKQIVDSLLDSMKDGEEYESIVKVVPKKLELGGEVVRGLAEIEKIRSRPCLAYIGNVVRNDNGGSGIDSTDDLPFLEMVNSVPQAEKKIDIFLATRGGSAHQISRFVNCLRSRFEEIDFIIPSFCMSAGTLFALSGNRIWMTSRACLGPIDPQIPTKDGRFVPAQALLLLLDNLQKSGNDALKNNQNIPWTAVRIIDSIDKKEIADAMTASAYSIQMATLFLLNYKLKNWQVREHSNQSVTQAYREARASTIAVELANHDKWKSHGHSISREILWDEIQLKIDHPDKDLERAIFRLWALLNWIFANTPVIKFIISQKYRYIQQEIQKEVKQ